MTMHDELNRVLKYALIPHTEVAPFVKSSQGRQDTLTPRVLADKFDENDDPRGDIIRRHLGETSHPEPEAFNSYSPAPVMFADQPADVHIHQGQASAPDGASFLTFQPIARDHSSFQPAGAIRALYSHWTPKTDEHTPKHMLFSGHFTPDETRAIADRLPTEHADALHMLVDAHFGAREGSVKA